MSLNCRFEEFRETRRIRGAIIHKHTGPKDFKIAVYCIEDNIDLVSEQKILFDYVRNMVLAIHQVNRTSILTRQKLTRHKTVL